MNLNEISKYIALILRHKPETIGISLDEHGWANAAINVGKRHGKAVIYKIKSHEMEKDGYDFFLSANQVWLTKRVPVKYLEKMN